MTDIIRLTERNKCLLGTRFDHSYLNNTILKIGNTFFILRSYSTAKVLSFLPESLFSDSYHLEVYKS